MTLYELYIAGANLRKVFLNLDLDIRRQKVIAGQFTLAETKEYLEAREYTYLTQISFLSTHNENMLRLLAEFMAVYEIANNITAPPSPLFINQLETCLSYV